MRLLLTIFKTTHKHIWPGTKTILVIAWMAEMMMLGQYLITRQSMMGEILTYRGLIVVLILLMYLMPTAMALLAVLRSPTKKTKKKSARATATETKTTSTPAQKAKTKTGANASDWLSRNIHEALCDVLAEKVRDAGWVSVNREISNLSLDEDYTITFMGAEQDVKGHAILKAWRDVGAKRHTPHVYDATRGRFGAN